MKRLEKERQAAKESLSLVGTCQGSKGMWVLKERSHQEVGVEESEKGSWGDQELVYSISRRRPDRTDGI